MMEKAAGRYCSAVWSTSKMSSPDPPLSDNFVDGAAKLIVEKLPLRLGRSRFPEFAVSLVRLSWTGCGLEASGRSISQVTEWS